MSNARVTEKARGESNVIATSPTPPKPIILVTSVAKEIKAVGALIWQIRKEDYGLVLRSEFVGGKQFRVVLPPLTTEPTAVPPEGTLPTHIVFDMPRLRAFLHSLSA